ncbi:MAG: inositol monophosphatase [Pseudomonadota bacterium]
MITDSQIDQVQALMREAAGTLILPRYQRLAQDEIDTKTSPTDLVTVADREAEEWLTPRLMELLPGSVVVGEEAASADRSVLNRLHGEAPVWLVDPVDGTANFVDGKREFGVMVALVERGVTLAGFIYAPVEDVMAVAMAGQGATLDGAALRGRQNISFDGAFGDYSSKYVEPPLREHLLAAVKASAGTRSGHCSAYAYLDAARGRVDYVLQYLMSPWDHAAGTLLVTEAGGAARFLDNGEAYSPIPRAARAALIVGDAGRWESYREEIQ